MVGVKNTTYNYARSPMTDRITCWFMVTPTPFQHFLCWQRHDGWHCRVYTGQPRDLFDGPGDWMRPTEEALRDSIQQFVDAQRSFVDAAAR